MIQEQLLLALVRSQNEAADDVLVEALRLGNDAERRRVLAALFERKSPRGLAGVVGQFDRLPEPMQAEVVRKIKLFHPALREAGRSPDPSLRVAAMKLVALGRQGRLSYVLTENLHESNEAVSRSAANAIVSLAKWVASETRALQRGLADEPDGGGAVAGTAKPTDSAASAGDADRAGPAPTAAEAYALLVEQRPEIEAAVARALDVHRGRHGPELLRAAILLIDSPASRAFQILATPKHGGQTTMVRRLQQAPSAEHVEAFLLGASHGHLRSQFAAAVAHVAEAPVLDALLRRTHWLKDQRLAVCMHTVGRGAWWTDADLQRDVERRRPEEAAKVGEWLAVSGSHDAFQDERLGRIKAVIGSGSVAGRLGLLRVLARRKRGTSVALLKTFLSDPDERLARMAVREVIRRRPQDFENTLLQLMAAAPPSVRRVVGRGIGQAGFELFWNKYDRLPPAVRKQAGRAMFKLLPDAPHRLRRKLSAGPVDQRLKALVMAQELGLAEPLRDLVLKLCQDPDARLRSKAVLVAGDLVGVTPDVLVDRLLKDADARVRANTIEVLEAKADTRFVPVLAERARASSNRERANAIKALFRMRVQTVSGQLFTMLKDDRPEHRISAMWALRQIGWWQLLGEVGRLAKSDGNVRVRRYALNVLKNVAEMAAAQGPPTVATGAGPTSADFGGGPVLARAG